MQSAAPNSFRPTWTTYLLRALGVVLAIEVGLILLTLPWTHLWMQSVWMTELHPSHPWLWAGLRSPGLRGAISGLGLINLWTAAGEIIPFRW